MSGQALALAAADLVGTPFRLHGRDPAHGLDCVGLFAVALEATGRKPRLPSGYSLRLSRAEPWVPDPAECGCVPASGPFEAGDAVLLHIQPAQFHLAIAAPDGGWIHAHAGLRRVVHQAVLPEGEIVKHWRLAPIN